MEKRTKEKIRAKSISARGGAFLVAQIRQQIWVSETIDWLVELFYT
ncbi:hypothetical protein [Listeria monocytogenes]|uniref:Uncharacterized protein n=1 Tax=Listeria monocytogenes serovar 1/2a (strain ATCC BAA-679 / EGD-e) TaxID=169963 RepID=Q6IEH1_LISMO|nr:hypothetical protein [Listeria monocytogenes]ADB67472.1 hypothetical protein LM5578_0717 [Listeria monocytogenes 08-5578]ADB70517.1 hypothetical protein LM5923_0672 [Listeria monocytogenes 08-5923]EAL06289.1 hypothetical protein LMOf6854_0685 [Listeria monocytogenes str. 1/2a F6854] [Listeria monocytogenes serotype 1/2a str. F6854]EFF97592.1 predicted protein [Listeria monocytogenes J2818]EXL14239.1 hypothetical protein X843_1534 [Listeria monocytogenes Lm_1840]EXL15709.1 hypothetical prot